MNKVTVAQVVGENCKRLRGEGQVTMETFSATAREYGLKWNTGRVGDFESGRVSPTLSTLYALTAALSRALERPLHLHELVHNFNQDGPDGGMVLVDINDTITVPNYTIAESLRGKPVQLAPNLDEFQARNVKLAEITKVAGNLPEEDLAEVLEIYRNAGLTEQRIARDLGTDLATVMVASHRLWGASFVSERDRIAGPDASPQARGRVSRELKAQLRNSI